ncbi:hypothetical protein [Pedobacter sp. KLB.chiD]|uniref:hypothetical protein n=1 Tax=Pedobacter sp. KLB.chiD TaxID=3387402 RepID=UPI00399C349F
MAFQLQLIFEPTRYMIISRGWNISGTAKLHYTNGLTGAIQSLAQLDPSAKVDAEKITAFVNQNPLDESRTNGTIREG